MKVLLKLVIAVSLIAGLTGNANANDRGVNGLIIGSGAGAIMGQAVGRNVESTIIGATVGGIIGAVIGTGGSHHQHRRGIIHKPAPSKHSRHFKTSPKHYSPRVTVKRPQWRGNSNSRETIVIYTQHDNRKKAHFNNHRRPYRNTNHR